ncbi:MAG: hypothetical protein IT559_07660 [Alphaproteobacteria bacterium]|nr:hypothetical protein [Alphaproteobacteria bacterium]
MTGSSIAHINDASALKKEGGPNLAEAQRLMQKGGRQRLEQEEKNEGLVWGAVLMASVNKFLAQFDLQNEPEPSQA